VGKLCICIGGLVHANKIPDSLPAKEVLTNENIFVMDEHRALHQDVRPLRIAILNLMPTKITTETQLLRLIGNTPIQVEIELCIRKPCIKEYSGRTFNKILQNL